jgi:hypothetical protein
MISVFTAFTTGVKNVFRMKRLVFLFYLIQFLFAAILTKSFSDLLTNTFSNSTLSDVLLKGFDYVYFSTMFSKFGQGVSLFGLFVPSLIFYIIITIFMTSGMYWLFYTRSKFNLKDYIYYCITYFSRFLKLYGLSFLFYFLCFLIFLVIFGIQGSLTENTISEVWPVILSLSGIALFILLVFLVMILFDYAKVILITENYSGMLSAVKEAMMFYMKNFFRTIWLYLLYIIVAILLFVIYWLITGSLNTDKTMSIFTYFILSQLFFFIRQYLRLALYNSVITYYQETVGAMSGKSDIKMPEKTVED